MGGYEVLRTKKKINLTILASGSEVNLAIETSHKLAKNKIYSKVISMPCQNLLIYNQNLIKKKFLMRLNLRYLLRQDQLMSGKKYIGNHGIAFGIDTFGKSAPYKEIFKHFGLTASINHE